MDDEIPKTKKQIINFANLHLQLKVSNWNNQSNKSTNSEYLYGYGLYGARSQTESTVSDIFFTKIRKITKVGNVVNFIFEVFCYS